MVIDANVVCGFDRTSKRAVDVETISGFMDKVGIDKAVISSNECMSYDFREGNEYVAEIVKKYPDRFIGFLSFHVSRFIELVEEVERGVQELGLRGIRLFNTERGTFGRGWSSGLESLVLGEIMQKANELRLPIFVEAGYPFSDIKRFAQAYPGTKIIASGAGYPNMGEAILAARQTENLYIETSTVEIVSGIDLLRENLEAEKIVFGTGMPFNAPSAQLIMVKSAAISEEDKRKILGGNMQRLLDMGEWK